MAKGKNGGDQLAIKIMPLQCENARTDVVPEPVSMSKALHECRVQLALNSLADRRRYCIPSEYTGFNCSKRTLIINGQYPDELIAYWDSWAKSKRSENNRPGKYCILRRKIAIIAVDFYDSQSNFMIMEMKYDGHDLDNFIPESAEQVKSIVLQIAFALGLAETELKFEHRDLYAVIYSMFINF